jgi:hypothetical protein
MDGAGPRDQTWKRLALVGRAAGRPEVQAVMRVLDFLLDPGGGGVVEHRGARRLHDKFLGVRIRDGRGRRRLGMGPSRPHKTRDRQGSASSTRHGRLGDRARPVFDFERGTCAVVPDFSKMRNKRNNWSSDLIWGAKVNGSLAMGNFKIVT